MSLLALPNQFIISGDLDKLIGLRLDQALAALFPEYSRSKLVFWLKQGIITVDSQITKPKIILKGGECIEIHQALSTTSSTSDEILPEALPLNIIYEDEHLMVINKPAGLVVHPGAGNLSGTLINGLVHYLPNLCHLPRAGIVHRLDKDTTGLLLIAKTQASHSKLVTMMQERAIHRCYIALVHGHIISGATIDTGFGRDPRNRLKMAVVPTGKQAVTTYQVKQHYHHTHVTLLEVNLLTGRTHQIRVHMQYIHHPIVGDLTYGGRMRIPKGLTESSQAAFGAFNRQALHAHKLSFIHPMNDTQIALEASLPDDFKNLLDHIDGQETR